MEAQCADAFGKEAKFLIDCPANVTMCRKIRQEVGDDIRYIRECAATGTASDSCLDRTGTYKVKMRYCQCGAKGCNGAANIQINIVAVLLPLFVVLITAFKKL